MRTARWTGGWLLVAGFAAALSFSGSGVAAEADAGFTPIFNGTSLEGWEGKDFWTVKDGAIVGTTTAEKPTEGNTFLLWQQGTLDDFELKLKYKIEGGNSGIQYRSHDHGDFVVGGYQADIDSPFKYTGMLYEEKGRGILMTAGEKIRIGETTLVPDTKKKDAKKKQTAVEKLPGATPTAAIAAAYKLGEWNELVITANGNQLRHTVNGVVTAEVTDTDASIAKSGVIALQLHVGPPMTIQFKNVYLKTQP